MREPKITINKTGLLRIDGIALFRIIERPNGNTTIQLCDSNRERSSIRGTRFVEIDPDLLISAIKKRNID
jgi:hypothetical protein